MDECFPNVKQSVFFSVCSARPRIVGIPCRRHFEPKTKESVAISEDVIVSEYVHGALQFKSFSIGDPSLASCQWSTYTLVHSSTETGQYTSGTRAYNPSCALRGNVIVLKHDKADARFFVDFNNVAEAFEVCQFIANAFECM